MAGRTEREPDGWTGLPRQPAAAAACEATDSGYADGSTLQAPTPQETAMSALTRSILGLVLAASAFSAPAQKAAEGAAAPDYDAQLARTLGADDYGMRHYVLVLLRTGPHPMPEGAARDAMFKGHMANIQRLARVHKLVLAGPLDGKDGLRGMFVFAVPDIDEAKKLVATDPTIAQGEMVAEYHAYYGSAALMLVEEMHDKVAKKSF
jgi:hypothetical protein